MNKCITCKYKSYHLRCLKCEQQAENSQPYVLPQILNPITDPVREFVSGLDDTQRLRLLGFICADISFRRLGTLLSISHHTAKKIARKAANRLSSLL